MMDVERIKEAAGHIRKGMDIFASGPLDYYLENLAASYELLLDRYAPYKVGDVVQLAYTPKIDEKTAPGWLGSKHYLVEGAECIVKAVSCGTKGFLFDVSFELESWIDAKKRVHPRPHDHVYSFRECHLRSAKGSDHAPS